MSHRKLGGQGAVVTGASKGIGADIARRLATNCAAVVVNNPGVYEFSPLEEITEEHFHKHLDVSVLGLLLATCPD
jgi:NAD(P)-dependent dehydrogenase (short-subunit alcohol dehydrogenase family)